jgi:hypothetical protein
MYLNQFDEVFVQGYANMHLQQGAKENLSDSPKSNKD